MIGFNTLVKLTDVVSCEALEHAALRYLPPKIHEQKLKAMRLGRGLP